MTVNSDLLNGATKEMAPRRVENLAESDENLVFVRNLLLVNIRAKSKMQHHV